MESKDVLVDTTIIIDHLRKKNKSSTIFFKLVSDNYDLHISVITLFELLSGAITANTFNAFQT